MAPAPTPQPASTRKSLLLIVATVAAGVGLISASRCSGEQDADMGTPSYTYRAAAEALVREHLRDPGSAQFSDVVVHPGGAAYATTVCGRVNGRNGFGGMGGSQRFIAGGTVALEGEIGAQAMDDLWKRSC